MVGIEDDDRFPVFRVGPDAASITDEMVQAAMEEA
jgi:hypothetical protein